MANPLKINALYTNGNKHPAVKTIYAPIAQCIIRPYTYVAGDPQFGDSTMNAIVDVACGEVHPKRYYTAQSVASLVTAAAS